MLNPVDNPVGGLIAAVLLIMSVSAWSIILYKLLQIQQQRKPHRQLKNCLTDSHNTSNGQHLVNLHRLLDDCPAAPLSAIAQKVLQAHNMQLHRASNYHQHEHALTQTIQHAIDDYAAHSRNGLTWLATVSSSAPFVGLFGTVWGVYHALNAIGQAGAATLATVAEPVSESLVMTALGLAVALPALIAYNLLSRYYHVQQSQAEALGFDLLHVLIHTRPNDQPSLPLS